jgi:hypothetical protein
MILLVNHQTEGLLSVYYRTTSLASGRLFPANEVALNKHLFLKWLKVAKLV